MKRFIKILFFIASVVAMIDCINRLIFRLACYGAKPFNEKVYKFRHGNVSYTTTGSGEPVLMVHGVGAGCSRDEWKKNVAALSLNHRVYALDLLGFGRSDAPNTDYTAFFYITLINDFIKDVIGKPVVGVGSSQGAAYLVMARAFAPDNFTKLVLVSPTGIGTTDEFTTEEDLAKKWMIELPVIGTLFYNFMSTVMFCKMFMAWHCFKNPLLATTQCARNYSTSARIRGSMGKLPIAAFIGKYLNVSTEGRYADINIPTLVVWGQCNRINPVANVDLIARENPDIEIAEFADSRLLPHVEQYEQFNNIVSEFIE